MNVIQALENNAISVRVTDSQRTHGAAEMEAVVL